MSIVKMEGCLNFRDLGGIKREGRKPTNEKKLYRADCLSKLTPNDIELMKELGIVYVIDIRSENETKTSGYPLFDDPYFEYINIPLSDDLHSENIAETLPRQMEDLYINIVDDFAPSVVRIFKLIAEKTRKSAVVFHCTAGKDRTGVISALMLQLSGVSDEDIIENYAQSYDNMKLYFEKMLTPLRKLGVKIPEHVFRSDPESMRRFLDYFYKNHKNTEEYLLKNGVTAEELEELKNLL